MSSDAEEYVHRPADAAGEPSVGAADSDDAEATAADDGSGPDGFGRRGWILVGVVCLSLLVVPGVIYAYPAAPAEAGLPFLVAMLVLPMLPAALLGATAVWSMTAATGDGRHAEEAGKARDDGSADDA